MTNKEIDEARREYDTLPDSEWRKDYFSPETGGYLVTSWERINVANKSNKETIKFEREHRMCLVFVKEGHRIKHLPDKKNNGEGTYDVLFDDYKADLKKTKSTNNIIKYAKRATRNQGAQLILFEFETWSNEFRHLIDELIKKNYHGRYYVSGEDQTHKF